MRRLPATLFATLSTTFEVAADPTKAPGILVLVASELGNGFRVAELTMTAEAHGRDGSDAIQKGEFVASVVLPVTLFHEIGHGDGYRLVGELLEQGENVPTFGSVGAASTDSTASRVPGVRAARQSASMLNVVFESGQCQRGTRAPAGVLRP